MSRISVVVDTRVVSSNLLIVLSINYFHLILSQFTSENFTETNFSVFKSYVTAGSTGESFSYCEWLREKTLDFTGTLYGEFFFSRQFSHTENGDDILEGFVILKDFFHIAGNTVMFNTDNVGVHNTGGGFEWIDSWVDTDFCDLTGQYSSSVQM